MTEAGDDLDANIERTKTQFWGYDQHERSVLDVVDEEEWKNQFEWAFEESIAYARMVECPETAIQARHCAARNFMGHFEAMLNDLLHEPLNICTATKTSQETEQTTLITDGGEQLEGDDVRDGDAGVAHPRHHELPNGGLAVVDEFRGRVRHAVTVEPGDRALYELVIDIFREADLRMRGCLAANIATAFDTLLEVERGLRDIDRGGTGVGDRWYGMSITLSVARAIAEYRDRPPLRLVAVGCSGSKHTDGGLLPAKERYRRAYWTCKREYGETIGDEWRIISAEHALLQPDDPIAYYERTPDDLRGIPIDSDARLPTGDPVQTLLDRWALDVYEGLAAWMQRAAGGVDPRDVDLEVLLGRSYRDPLEERGVFEALRGPAEVSISFPFQEEDDARGGNGNQMGWMADEVEAMVATDGGVDDE